MAEPAYDSKRAEAFAGRMLDMLNGGALAVMISVGHRTALFDALAELDGATSHELADGRRARTSATCASGSAR